MGEATLVATLFLILGAEFVNGWTDAPNAITTVVSTRVLSLKKAVVMAAILNILGVMSGTAVAATIGKGFIKSDMVSLYTIAAAMSAIMIWSTLAWRKGLPTSESHALVAAITGAGLATGGVDALLWIGWQKVVIGLAFSTFLGFAIAYLITKVIRRTFARVPSKTTQKTFGYLQLFSSAFMAFNHGLNDGQKFMGVFALALVIGGITSSFSIPFWVILTAASAMGIGTAFGGWRIVKTMGIKMLPLETYQGFAAETGADIAIQIASRSGIPLSTTHTIGTALMGAGMGNRLSSLNVRVIKNVVLAWLLTFPVCFTIGFIMTYPFRFLFLFLLSLT